MNYRREIDGLRAVAVLPVIFFHAGFELFAGGYVGVDVFFVISGYLITTIILGEQAQGRFSLAGFYERRARRILPALIFMVLGVVPFAWWWLPPESLEQFSESVIAVSVFLSNFFFWDEIGYFDTAAELKPLLHTWSLAVEEQYYLLAPLLMLLLWPLGYRWLALGLALVAMASFLLAEWWVLRDPAGAFFLLPARAWELMAGALVAVYLWRRQPPALEWPRLRALMGGAGLVLIAVAVFMLDAQTPFPGRYALLPVGGTVLVILFCSPRDLFGWLLGTRLLVGLGLVSYSAYLWHQPLFALSRMRTVEAPPDTTMWFLILLTFVLATLSWRVVERPFRDRSATSRKTIVYSALGATLLCIVVGAVGKETDGAPQRLSGFDRMLHEVSGEGNPTGGVCSSFDLGPGLPLDECVPAGDFDARLLIIGDSHTNALSYVFMQQQDEIDIGVTQLSHSACMSVPGTSRSGRTDECAHHTNMVDEYIRSESRDDFIMLASRWTLNFEGTRFDNREGGVEYGDEGAAWPIGETPASDQERKAALARALDRQIHEYLALGKQVILMYPIPEAGWHVPYRMMRKAEEHFPDRFASTSYTVFRQRNADTIRLFDNIEDHSGLIRFRPHEVLCDTYLPERCVTQLDGVSLYKDEHHLSRAGAALVAEPLIRTLRARINDEGHRQ